MRTDSVEFWNEIWSTMDHTFADHDQALVDHVEDLRPGRTLDLGCGSGGNAVWLAEHGWQVTAVDFSEVAIAKAKARAAERGVEVEFVASDVTTYRPNRLYDLITTFYIQLWPDQRARMLSMAVESLALGGKLLFVSHDKSAPPSGWSQEDLESLTTPDEVVAELPSLRIERAEVVEEAGTHMDDMPDPDEGDDHHHESHEHDHVDRSEGEYHSHGASTVVVAVKPGGSS